MCRWQCRYNKFKKVICSLLREMKTESDFRKTSVKILSWNHNEFVALIKIQTSILNPRQTRLFVFIIIITMECWQIEENITKGSLLFFPSPSPLSGVSCGFKQRVSVEILRDKEKDFGHVNLAILFKKKEKGKRTSSWSKTSSSQLMEREKQTFFYANAA